MYVPYSPSKLFPLHGGISETRPPIHVRPFKWTSLLPGVRHARVVVVLDVDCLPANDIFSSGLTPSIMSTLLRVLSPLPLQCAPLVTSC